MQQLRGNQLLHEISFVDRSSQFQISEYSHLEEYERRTRSHISQRLADEDQQLSLSISLRSEMLITHFVIETIQQNPFKDLLQFLIVESTSLSDMQQYKKMLNTSFKPVEELDNRCNCLVEAIAFSRGFKFTFILKQQHLNSYMQQHGLKLQKSRVGFENSINALMKVLFRKLQVWGYQPNSNPPASHLTQLMNISHILKKTSREDEAAEADILLGLSLISARRFNQAVQLLKKVSSSFLSRYESAKNNEMLSIGQGRRDLSMTENHNKSKGGIQLDIFSFGWVNGTSIPNNNKKNLIRAAKIELLIAEATNHPSMVYDRILAYHRATAYFTGNVSPDTNLKSYDIYTALLMVGPQLMCFLIKTLYDKFEPAKIAAIKGLQFLLESLGCSIGSYLPQLVKSIIATYPSHNQANLQYNPLSYRIGINLEDEHGKSQADHSSKLVIDHHHHLLESIVNLIPGLSRSICRQLFIQVVLSNVFVTELSNEVRVYVLRIAQKVISMCLGDLDIQPAFVSNFLSVCEGKGPLFPKDKNNSSIVYHFQRTWDTLKSKYLPSLRGERLTRLAEWVNETLVLFCEHDLSNVNLVSLEQILDIVNVIYQKEVPHTTAHPIQPLLYFLNVAIAQTTLPFDKILVSLMNVLKSFVSQNEESDIIGDIVSKIIAKTTFDSLNLKELTFLIEVLRLSQSGDKAWLERFLQCVPHSTFDETFVVVDELLVRCKDWFSETTLIKLINALLDQYTVKGKAHKKTKELIIQLLLKSDYIEIFLDISLVSNREPVTHSQQINRYKIKHFDSKLYSKSFELFSEKLAFACELIRLMSYQQLERIISSGFIVKICNGLARLSESKNSKNRIQSTCIIRYILDIYEQGRPNKSPDQEPTILSNDLLLARSLLPILKTHLLQFKEARIQLNCLLMVKKLFECVLIADDRFLKSYKNASLTSSISETDLEALDLSKEFSIRWNDPMYLNIRVREIVKLWTALMPYLSSPWGYIRECCCQLIQLFARVDLSRYKSCYQEKLSELLQPILTNLLSSQQHCDRTAGLRIYALAIGMSAQYEDVSCVALFRAKSIPLKEHYTQIELLENDWCTEVSQLASTIIQLGVCKEMRNTVRKRNNSQKNSINNLISSSFFSFNLPENGDFELREEPETLVNLSANIDHFLKETEAIAECSEICSDERSNSQLYPKDHSFINIPDDVLTYWLEKEDFQTLNNHLEQFRKPPSFYQSDWHYTSPGEGEPLQEQFDQPLHIAAAVKAEEAKEEELDFQSLGIIQVDDEEWTDYEHEVRLIQKLPLKRKYKLSPNLASPNTANPSKIDALVPEKEIREQVERPSPRQIKTETEHIKKENNNNGLHLVEAEKADNTSSQNQMFISDNQDSDQQLDDKEEKTSEEGLPQKKIKVMMKKPSTKKQQKEDANSKETKTTAVSGQRKKPSSADPAKSKKRMKKAG